MLNDQKLYYSISEVSEYLQVNASLIRFWEKEFPQLKPKKNTKGNRQFTKEDVETLKSIYYLVKDRGYTLSGAKDKLKKERNSTKKEVEVVDALNNIKKFLLDIKKEL